MRFIVEQRELPQSNVSNLVMYVMFGTAGLVYPARWVSVGWLVLVRAPGMVCQEISQHIASRARGALLIELAEKSSDAGGIAVCGLFSCAPE